MANLIKEQVQNAIAPYLKYTGFTSERLAEKAGIGISVLIKIKRGEWAGIDDKIFKKVWQIINPATIEGLFQTADLKSAIDAMNNAVKYKRMIAITGDTGMGKTTALRSYAIMKPNVFTMYLDGTTTPIVFLTELLREMGISCYGSPAEMRDKVVVELNSLEEPLLIIDEFGKAKDKLILLIHSIRDRTKDNAGIVIAGMPRFKNDMIKKVNSGVNGYSEFFRRVNIWHELNGLSKDEITYILEQNGITDKGEQMEYRNFRRFGDLDNAINLHKTLNN